MHPQLDKISRQFEVFSRLVDEISDAAIRNDIQTQDAGIETENEPFSLALRFAPASDGDCISIASNGREAIWENARNMRSAITDAIAIFEHLESKGLGAEEWTKNPRAANDTFSIRLFRDNLELGFDLCLRPHNPHVAVGIYWLNQSTEKDDFVTIAISSHGCGWNCRTATRTTYSGLTRTPIQALLHKLQINFGCMAVKEEWPQIVNQIVDLFKHRRY